ncbi:SPOR domain-containing protein [Porticoccus sp.]|nr:MAG: hypothetical protein EP324_04620 [Gammaproteobacteria bacterium]
MMKYRAIGLLLGSSLLVACASQSPPDEPYVGWVCDGPRNSDNWSCVMQGENGDEAIAATPASSTDSAVEPEQVSTSVKATQVVGLPSRDWREQLPSMTATPLHQEGARPTVKPTAKRSPRVAKPVSEVWSEPEKHSPSQPVVVKAMAEPLQPVKGIDVSGARSGYTLQLGAFADNDQLQSFLSSHKLADLPVHRSQTYSRKQLWQVLTWGEFASPEEARSAWRKISERYPGIEPWVRSVSSLDNTAQAAAEVDG